MFSFGAGGSGSESALLAENAISLLNASISRMMGQHTLPTWSNHLDPMQNFLAALELLRNGGDVDELLSNTLDEVCMSTCVIVTK